MDLDRYCTRIGYDGPRKPTLDVLRGLHLCHAQSIPFENLNPLLGLPVPLDVPSLERKLVDEGRGGWCFEQNGLFLAVLRAFGFRARGLGARVLWGAQAGHVPPRSHMVIEVDVDGRSWLADVGFGGVTLTAPVQLVEDIEQATPHEVFRLGRGADLDFVLEVRLEHWAPMYRFRLEEQLPPDYEVGSFYLCHHPSSFFRQELRAARAFPGGRFALRNNRLVRYRSGAAPETRILSSAAELKTCLQEDLLIRLPQEPSLEVTLGRLVDAGAP